MIDGHGPALPLALADGQMNFVRSRLRYQMTAAFEIAFDEGFQEASGGNRGTVNQ